MGPTGKRDLSEIVESLSALVRSAALDRSPEAFESVEQQISRFEAMVREVQQARCSAETKRAIRNLQQGQPLAPEELEAIRMMVVGDAEFYLKHENNLNEWLAELDRLMAEVRRLAATGEDRALAELRGVLRDAVRLLPNIRSYMEEKRRLDRFNTAFASLDPANRRLLVELLQEMLDSPRR